MGVNRNLLGGIALRDAIKASMPSATINNEGRYIQFSASAETSITISDAAGMVFKPNTQYTFILSLFKTSGNGSNLRVNYTDGTNDIIPALSAATMKETIVFTSNSGKTISSFAKRNSSGSTRVYYDESGIFEGVLTTLDFEPYQAWGITMSGIRRSLVEAALHDDSTVAAPIATFSTDVSAPAKSVLAAFSPIQDLHGYDNPWPAGGGKNLFDPTANPGKWIGFDGTLSNVTGAKTSQKIETGGAVETYVLSAEGTATGILCIAGYAADDSLVNRKALNGVNNISFTATAEMAYIRGAVYSDLTMQLEKSASKTDFAPYSNICPISGWTGLSITRVGKNFYDVSQITWTAGIKNGSGEPTSSSASHYTSNFTKVFPSTNYVMSGKLGGGTTSWAIYFYDENKNWISRTPAISYTISFHAFTTQPNCHYIQIQCAKTISAPTDWMLELGSTVTAYAPYQGSTIQISWQTEAGTVYGGTLDVVSGVLTVTHGEIASYNGETLPAAWISDRDVYDAETTPSIGAQVVYELATPQTYQLNPQTVRMLKGANNLWQSENGDVTVGYWLHG